MIRNPSWPSHAPVPAHEHGEHVPGQGYYDAFTARFVQDQRNLTGIVRTTRRPLDGVEYRTDTSSTAELARRAQVDLWSPNPQMEQLRKLRARDRAAFGQLAFGPRRMTLARYETGLREYSPLAASCPTASCLQTPHEPPRAGRQRHPWGHWAPIRERSAESESDFFLP